MYRSNLKSIALPVPEIIIAIEVLVGVVEEGARMIFLQGGPKFEVTPLRPGINVLADRQGRCLYVFKVFIEYPLNFSSDCILMFSVKLTFDKILIM